MKKTERETDPMMQGSLLQAATKTATRNTSLVLLAAEPSKLVGDHNIKLCSTLHNLLTLAGGDIVSNLSTVCPIQTEDRS
jgi:hypothetical protein